MSEVALAGAAVLEQPAATSSRGTGMSKTKAKASGKSSAGADEGDEMKSRKTEALTRALQQIEKQFGAGSIQRLDSQLIKVIPAISTGALSLDLALGVGGMPMGRVVEVFGPESSGKTTLALTVVGNAQKKGGYAAFIDAEHALDPAYARKLGVNLDELLVSQPDTGEQAMEICEQLVRSNALDIVVIDSVAALVPRAEIEGEMGDSHVGLQARLMSQALRKLTAAISRSHTCVIFINQIREKIGVMFGSPETTPGGRALKFYSSVRVDVRRIGTLKDGETPIGSAVRCKVVKNKVAPPFRQAEFDIMYDSGISWEGSVLDQGIILGAIEKSGAWFSYNGNRLGQGRENARKFLKDNPDVCEEVRRKVMENSAIMTGSGLTSGGVMAGPAESSGADE